MDPSDVPVLAPPTEINDASLPAFEEALAPLASADGPGVVLDLAAVHFINSAGLGTLVRVGMRMDTDGRRLALARPNRTIDRMLRMVGLQVKLPVFRSIDEARGFLVAHGPPDAE